jgi:hypothetical protein
MAAFAMRYFVPTARQTNSLILLAFAALVLAFYLRHSIIDSQPLIAACTAGAVRASCPMRVFLIELTEMQFFGGLALVAAILHLIRPRLGMFAIALVATSFGLLLANAGPAAFAAGLLIIAFARPAHARTRAPVRIEPPRTTRPASSKASR